MASLLPMHKVKNFKVKKSYEISFVIKQNVKYSPCFLQCYSIPNTGTRMGSTRCRIQLRVRGNYTCKKTRYKIRNRIIVDCYSLFICIK